MFVGKIKANQCQLITSCRYVIVLTDFYLLNQHKSDRDGINMAASQRSDAVDVLVREMGFARSEATMAFADCNGNMELAVEKLLAGEYAPPPYSDVQEDSASGLNCDDVKISYDSTVRPTFGHEKGMHGIDFGVDANPPPYTKVCLQSELNSWEIKSQATFCNLNSSYSRVGGGSFARCSTCFDEIFENEKSGASNKAVRDGIRVCVFALIS